MSSADKIETLRKAKEAGYFIRLFYVTTRDPDINVSRVRNRREKGGHSVPVQKIHERYWRSLENLADALLLADEAYLYDNSTNGSASLEIARLKNGILTVTADEVPSWYIRFVEEKIASR
jgi:predicted ABC-type ATPase